MELEDLTQSGPHRRSGLTAAYAGWVHPNHRGPGEPAQVKGTVSVNYTCGVSKPWRDVTAAEKDILARLAP